MTIGEGLEIVGIAVGAIGAGLLLMDFAQRLGAEWAEVIRDTFPPEDDCSDYDPALDRFPALPVDYPK